MCKYIIMILFLSPADPDSAGAAVNKNTFRDRRTVQLSRDYRWDGRLSHMWWQRLRRNITSLSLFKTGGRNVCVFYLRQSCGQCVCVSISPGQTLSLINLGSLTSEECPSVTSQVEEGGRDGEEEKKKHTNTVSRSRRSLKGHVCPTSSSLPQIVPPRRELLHQWNSHVSAEWTTAALTPPPPSSKLPTAFPVWLYQCVKRPVSLCLTSQTETVSWVEGEN